MKFDRSMSIVFALQAVLFFACGESDSDLPDAFDGAVQVEVTMGAVGGGADICDGGAAASELKATVVDGNIRVLFEGCFPCEVEKQEAFVKQTDNGCQILFRPPVLEYHNACGSHLYDMRLMAGPGGAGDTVTVFTQATRDDEPVHKAETPVFADPVDCANLTPCSIDTPCDREGFAMDERSDEYYMGCTTLESCGGSFCIWDQEACMMECGTTDCMTLDTDPPVPSCE